MTSQIKSNEIQALQNAHPGIDLARAMRRFMGLKEKAIGRTTFVRKELVDALGFGPKSGGATLVISALVHFGLLRRVETEYFYTDLGEKLSTTPSDSQGYVELLTKALRNPELYKWLENKYADEILPDEIEDILIGRYHDRNVRKDNVKTIISNYRKSVAFVKDIPRKTEKEIALDEYISVSFRDSTIPIYKRYLLEAIQKTHEDDLMKTNRSLNDI